MAAQEAVTIRAFLRPGAVAALEIALARISADVEENSIIPFGRMGTVHFARFVILNDAEVNGRIVPASLIYASNVDGSANDHLRELASLGALDQVWQHCENYPAAAARTRESRLGFLGGHTIASQTFYVNTIGRTVRQARDEAVLREALQRILDEDRLHDRSKRESARNVALMLRDAVKNDSTLCPMLLRAEGLSPLPGRSGITEI